MRSWIQDLAHLLNNGTPTVLLTVSSVRGSAPREVGARMLVTATESIGTIGGGELEYQCIRLACNQLRDAREFDARENSDSTRTRRFVLGANCGQCCGGVVEIMFESLAASNIDWLYSLAEFYRQRQLVVLAATRSGPLKRFLITDNHCSSFPLGECCPSDVIATARMMLETVTSAQVVGDYLLEPLREAEFHVAIFGAGHVGAATVDAMGRLDCHIRWIDSRRSIFPAMVPENVTMVETADPASEVAALSSGAYFLVMTHSHSLDQEICQRVLAREDFAYCGLIGSASKRRRFVRRMREHGVAGRLLERLTCPIGVAGIDGKKPVEIAISVAAEVLQVRAAIVAGKKSESDYMEATA